MMHRIRILWLANVCLLFGLLTGGCNGCNNATTSICGEADCACEASTDCDGDLLCDGTAKTCRAAVACADAACVANQACQEAASKTDAVCLEECDGIYTGCCPHSSPALVESFATGTV